MEKKKTTRLTDILSDKFSDVWKLLSETTVFLSRTGKMDAYEIQLRVWRSELQTASRNPDVTQRIRSELTELRKQLRLQGYDLSLGKQNLIVDGFRNDACLGEGFRRVVVFISDTTIYSLAGDDNHVALAEFLERQLETESAAHKVRLQIKDRHYLWYLRHGQDLILSGSDTETKADFERFAAICNANSLFILSGLKHLR
ncbi:hypothetical protein TREPR_0059 [Treponema primitia ZAS-2]|uniref:Uncharacterized protein n=1 Tax=Treponema primitia (strain ATCC BAA-887 / DSM 12427 / ZAS-2) TaxID=545694 RepID=F5YND1_TREPZ|nr:hypothetical protein [Treponema primitia]AEF84013.1 hypothetical protein TREPR_0059 [Treponema primitia ZAS-2]